MKDIKEYIESGILELYVTGLTSAEEAKEVEQMATTFYEVRMAITEIGEAMELYAQAHAIPPDPIIKPFLLAMIDYTERMNNGEQVSRVPLLYEGSKIADYDQWLSRPDMLLPQDFTEVHAKIIGYTPEVITAILWIKDMAPQEVHTAEYEKFIIIEGTCDIIIETEIHQLSPGDYLSIPLHKGHMVKVTSDIPCKAILQRVAA